MSDRDRRRPGAAPRDEQVDVAVIGGGQAGLAAGFWLAERGLRYLIVDAAPSPGHTWRARWDALTLLTPCPYNSLPGTPFPGPDGSFPRKDDVADYLDDYQRRHGLRLRRATEVTELRRAGERFVLALAGDDDTTDRAPRTVAARAVVIATGPYREPAVPAFASAARLWHVHSAGYRAPAQLPPGAVLVVGAGNSGAGIAVDLARSHRVTWSLGATATSPRRILGRDLFWWAHKSGLVHLPAHWSLARRMQSGPDALIGETPAQLAARHGLALAPRTVAFAGDQARFADGSTRRFDAVVWATGFQPSHPMLAPLAEAGAPLLDDRGRPRHRDGLSPLPGLVWLGLPWQRRIDSSLLGGVGRDARFVVAHLERYLTGRAVAAPSWRCERAPPPDRPRR
jgi:putative flavoprotein involved in K+ transport